MKFIKDNFLVVSDYNWLPSDLKNSWVDKLSDNYLIYDRFHRYQTSKNVIWQKNVGQNHYDMFDFIINNYDSLPDCTIFCRSCFMFPKDTGVPRYNDNGKRISTGNCSEEFFLKNANNKVFTELNDFYTEPWRFDGISNKIGPNNSYMEQNSSWYFNQLPHKYYNNIYSFFNDMYDNPSVPNYIRFSPGGNYIIPKNHILKYNKKFYEKIRDILSWGVIIGETHMIERATYLIFNNDFSVKSEYLP